MPKVRAHRRLGGASVERSDDRAELLRVDRDGTAASSTATTRCGKPGLHALLDQGSLELCESPEYVEQ